MKKKVSKRTKELRVLVAILTFSLMGVVMLNSLPSASPDRGLSDLAGQQETGLEIDPQGMTYDGKKLPEQSSQESSAQSASYEPSARQQAKKQEEFSFASLASPVASTQLTMAYSHNTTPVYSKTFNQFRSDHTGIDLKAASGEEVRAAAAGTVEKIYDDEKLGKTVILSHTDGVKTVYANLSSSLSVKEGQSVKKGTVLGTVGGTALYESGDEPHVHFALMKDGIYLDPTSYIVK